MVCHHDAMSWLDAVSSWIESLAWPAAAIVLGFLLRRQIGDALRKVSHIEVPGIKADFREGLQDVEAAAKDLTEALPDVPKGAGSSTQDSDEKPPVMPVPAIEEAPARRADVNPSAIVLAAWMTVYREVVSYARVTGAIGRARSPSMTNMTALLNLLMGRSLMSRQMAALISELSDLRNRVAYGDHTPSAGEAITYENSAQSLVSVLTFQREAFAAHPPVYGDQDRPNRT